MLNDEVKYWAIVVGMTVYAFLRSSGDMPLWRRMMMTSASTFIGIGLGSDFGEWSGLGDRAGTGLLIGFSLIVLDVIHAILINTDFIERFLRAKTGISKSEDK